MVHTIRMKTYHPRQTVATASAKVHIGLSWLVKRTVTCEAIDTACESLIIRKYSTYLSS